MVRGCRAEHCGLLWFPLSFRDELWRVLLAEPTQCRLRVRRKVQPCAGVTCFDHRTIIISVDQDDDEIECTVWHEINHAAIGNGIGERQVAAAERGLRDAARSLGAVLPPYPRGFHAMRERASWSSE